MSGSYARTFVSVVATNESKCVCARISIKLISSCRHNNFCFSCVFTINDSLAQCVYNINTYWCAYTLAFTLCQFWFWRRKKWVFFFSSETIHKKQHFIIGIVIIIIFNFNGLCCVAFFFSLHHSLSLSLSAIRSMNFNTAHSIESIASNDIYTYILIRIPTQEII